MFVCRYQRMHRITFSFQKICLFIFNLLLMASCRNTAHPSISKTIDAFYTAEAATDYRLANKNLLTPSLVADINLAAAHQAFSEQSIRESGATDKPDMIEGDIFTSVMEGSTDHQIMDIRITDTVAIATVQFRNQHYSNLEWTDTAVLVQHTDTWKIDDIRYAAGRGVAPSTRAVLRWWLRQWGIDPVSAPEKR